MIKVVLLFVLLLASVWLGIHLQQDSGYVLLAYKHWTVETTLWVAFFALLLLFVLLHLLLNLTRKILRSPGYWQHQVSRHRRWKAQKMTRQGLIEFSEGYWQKAKNHLIKALPNTDTPLLNYLTAARAAQNMGDHQLRDDYLREAQQSMPEAKIAVELTQAELQLANQQLEQALATLRHLHDLAPHHPYVLKLLVQIYQEIGDWTQLLNLLPALKKYKVLGSSEYEQLQIQAYLGQLTDLIKQGQAEPVTAFINACPRSMLNNPQLLACYALYLIDQGQGEQADEVLKRGLKKEFNPSLAALLGHGSNPARSLQFAEQFIKKHPDDDSLYLTLGRLSQACQLWGKAKNYLERSLELKPTKAAYFQLGQLYEQLNDPIKACHYYKQGF